MPNIATVLKQEITRLARKEIKAATDTTRKANARHRHEIAQLKREVNTLNRRISHLERQEQRRTPEAAPGLAEGRRFSRHGLKSHREKVGLSAADYADLVGVSAQTVYSWEQGKSRPRDLQLAALVSVRGLGKRDAQRRLEMLRG